MQGSCQTPCSAELSRSCSRSLGGRAVWAPSVGVTACSALPHPSKNEFHPALTRRVRGKEAADNRPAKPLCIFPFGSSLNTPLDGNLNTEWRGAVLAQKVRLCSLSTHFPSPVLLRQTNKSRNSPHWPNPQVPTPPHRTCGHLRVENTGHWEGRWCQGLARTTTRLQNI